MDYRRTPDGVHQDLWLSVMTSNRVWGYLVCGTMLLQPSRLDLKWVKKHEQVVFLGGEIIRE
jgi:hypothetical protein